jgi:hypothetical protein
MTKTTMSFLLVLLALAAPAFAQCVPNLPAAEYPGNGGDATILVFKNGVADTPANGVHVVQGGDQLDVLLISPCHTLDIQPFLFASQAFTTGTPPVGLRLFPADPQPSIWLAPLEAQVIVNGFANPFQQFNPVLYTQGFPLGSTVPLALAGMQISVMAQLFAFAPGTNPVSLAISDAHEFQIQ